MTTPTNAPAFGLEQVLANIGRWPAAYRRRWYNEHATRLLVAVADLKTAIENVQGQAPEHAPDPGEWAGLQEVAGNLGEVLAAQEEVLRRLAGAEAVNTADDVVAGLREPAEPEPPPASAISD